MLRIPKIYFFASLVLALKGCVWAQEQEKRVASQPALSRVVPVAVPGSLAFAGENVPLLDEDVRERLERELTQMCYKHSTTLLTLKRFPRWRDKIISILRQEGVPEDFIYVAAIESDLDPYANSGKAEGFWQLVPTTALQEGLEVDTSRSSPTGQVDQRRDVVEATKAACRIFKRDYSRLNNWTLVALAYNQGYSRTVALKNAQQAGSYYDMYLSPEPYRYVFRILAMKLILENPARYGFDLTPYDFYQPLKTQTIVVDQSIDNLVDFAREKGLTYKTLKYYNPWLVFRPNDYRFTVPAGKSYRFEIPAQ